MKTAEEERPNIVWFYNVQLIAPRVVKKLKSLLPDAIFCQYANDNPFSKNAKPHLWKNFRESIPFFDAHFVFRDSDSHGYLAHGVNEVKLLRSYFIPEMDYPVLLPEIPQQYICDVVFAGHYENDGRVEMLEAICDAGFNLNLFGGGWNLALKGLRLDSPLRSKYPITPVIEENYRYAICGAKVALCFLSTLNQDTYTTRNFQIPAMKTAMLSQYTDDLASLFKPGEEALYFESAKELLAKLRVLVEDEGLRSRLATAGYMRVHSDGHDVSSRMQIWLRDVLGKGENE
ncbi:MAG: glycosyltransferase family 1 protein [Pseudohongiella sp.]|nr:glycosyltransferase family 1 protein [Pseudohongiella sp.]